MSKLTPTPILGGYTQNWPGLTIEELTDYELVSLSVARGEDETFAKAFKKQFKSELPEPNHVLPAEGGSVMWLEPDTYLVMLGSRDIDADRRLGQAFGTSAYPVLLSDGWVPLRVSGPHQHDVFERFINLDLRNAAPDFATRTSAHHISVIVVTLLDGATLLITPRSSALSFRAALSHVIDNITAEA